MTLDCVAPIKSIRARRCPQHNHCLELHFQHSSETMYVPESMMVLFNWMIMECVGASCRISTCGDCDVDIDSIELSQSAPHCKILNIICPSIRRLNKLQALCPEDSSLAFQAYMVSHFIYALNTSHHQLIATLCRPLTHVSLSSNFLWSHDSISVGDASIIWMSWS